METSGNWVGGGAAWLKNLEISMKVSGVKGRTAPNGLLFSSPLHQVRIQSVLHRWQS